ncbi:thioredoxin [Candidatus Omnitrophota bacterium]
MSLVHLTDKNFDSEVLASKEPVLVDFSAEWCGPCKMVAPIIEELANEYDGKIKIAKLDVDEGQGAATKYSVMAVPTLMFFKDGAVVEQISGALNKSQLKSKIDKNLL